MALALLGALAALLLLSRVHDAQLRRFLQGKQPKRGNEHAHSQGD